MTDWHKSMCKEKTMEKIMKKIKKIAWAFFCIGAALICGAGTVGWGTEAINAFADEDDLY